MNTLQKRSTLSRLRKFAACARLVKRHRAEKRASWASDNAKRNALRVGGDMAIPGALAGAIIDLSLKGNGGMGAGLGAIAGSGIGSIIGARRGYKDVIAAQNLIKKLNALGLIENGKLKGISSETFDTLEDNERGILSYMLDRPGSGQDMIATALRSK